MSANPFPDEQSLYEPVEAFWQSQGYEVKGEVKDCDVVAIRAQEEPVLIELKLSFNIQLLTQAARRKKISSTVYVAIPEPSQRKRASDWKMICRAMNIGLLFVTSEYIVLEVVTPTSRTTSKPIRKSKKRKALMKEFSTRKSNQNRGGSTRKKLLTAYREQAITIAYSLIQHEQGLSALDVRKQSGVVRTSDILRTNVYGWFERHDPKLNLKGKQPRPFYTITETGKLEYADWNTKWTNPMQENNLKLPES